jgi:hypothetical protein
LLLANEITKNLTKPKNIGKINENEFYNFSKFLLNENELDKEFSKKIYKFLANNNNDIYKLYEFIRTHPIYETSLLRKHLQSNKFFQKTYSQIAISWYTGANTLGKLSMRFTYFDAYMFKLIGGFAPTPGTCGGTTNYWSQKPDIK